jgi:Zn-dependent peptidase ImmA (M78 family)
MNIPKTIKILGRTFVIEMIDLKKEKDNYQLGGYLLYEDQRIAIDNTKHKEHQESTLLHEIIHAIVFMQAIELKEKDIERLEAGLYQVIKDNPEIFMSFIDWQIKPQEHNG